MADAPTMGFEFAYNLDGSNHTPAMMKLPVDGNAQSAGDLMVVSSGNLTAVAANASAFTAVLAEDVPSTASAGDKYYAYVLQPGQVWRVSGDAATIAADVGNAAVDVVDENTYDASSTSGGHLILFDKGELDSDGNRIAYVCFQAADLTYA